VYWQKPIVANVHLNHNLFKESLKKIGGIGNEEVPVNLSFKDNAAYFRAIDDDGSEATDVIPCGYTGQEFNCRFILSNLNLAFSLITGVEESWVNFGEHIMFLDGNNTRVAMAGV